MLIGKSVCELKRMELIDFDEYALYNRDISIRYSPESIIKETNIRNVFRLIIM